MRSSTFRTALPYAKNDRVLGIKLQQPFTKDRDHTSARLRMMQRNSIYDPKQPRQKEQPQARAPSRQQPPSSRTFASALPATQIVSRPDVRVPPARKPDHLPQKELVVKLNYRKRRAEEVVPVPRMTRSQAKKNNDATQNTPEATSGFETQAVNEPAAKRRKPNSNTGKQARPETKTAASNVTKVNSNAACLVKTSPRKAVMATQRDGAAGKQAQLPTNASTGLQQSSVSPRKKKTTQSPSVARPSVPIAPARPKNTATPSSRTVSPRKPALSSKSNQRKKPQETPLIKSMASSSTVEPSSSPSKVASRRRQRPTLTMLVTPDQATLEAMERDDTLLF